MKFPSVLAARRIAVMATAACALAFARETPAANLLLDNFNTGTTGSAPAGWTAVTTGGTVTVAELPSATDKSVQLAKPMSANVVSATRSFTPTSGKVAVEMKIRIAGSSGSKTLPYIYSSDGTKAATIAFVGSNLVSYVGSTQTTVQAINSSVWYLVRIEMDTDSDTYDLYVNGVKKLTAAALQNPVSDIAKVTFAVEGGTFSPAFFDSVNIYEMAVPAATGAYVLKENFNTGTTGSAPAGWTTSGPTATIREIPFALDKSLRITRSASDGSATARKSFSALSGKLTFEVKVRTEDTTGFKNILYLNSTSGALAISIGFNGNNLRTFNGSTSVNVPVVDTVDSSTHVFTPALNSVVAGMWYAVRVVLDTDTDKYDLYVDGIKRLTQADFRNPATDISSYMCGMDTSNTGTMYIDNIKAYTLSGLIGAPPAPVFDVASYGAVGDGTTDNTAAIQAAIEACAGSGGSVYLHDGTFLTGMIQLRSAMTLYVGPTATILGSTDDAAYPSQTLPDTSSVAAGSLRKSLIYLAGASNVTIDGGGTINGNGLIAKWALNSNGTEADRPVLISPHTCNTLAVQNLYLQDGAVWCVVPVETNYFVFRNILMNSRSYGNRDGLDMTDVQHALVEDCTFNTDDDAICPKSGIRSGVNDVYVRNCYIMGSVRANGIKFGTASYGAFKNMVFEDIYEKHVAGAAMALESVDGADIANITFRRIELNDVNGPFYLTIGSRANTPSNDVAKIGSINRILFEDVYARNLNSNNGSPISGSVINGVRYPLQNLTFRRCNITFPGGSTTFPSSPPEAGAEYPEITNWGKLPAYGYYLRHVDGVTFESCITSVSSSDIRPYRLLVDVSNSVDAYPPVAGSLAVAAVQLDPESPTSAEQTAGFTSASDFGYIDLVNVGSVTLDLDGLTLVGDIESSFSGSTLAPGEHAIVASNADAYQFRYGTDKTVVGIFQNGTQLSPLAGQQLQLLARDGTSLLNYTTSLATPTPEPTPQGNLPTVFNPKLVVKRAGSRLRVQGTFSDADGIGMLQASVNGKKASAKLTIQGDGTKGRWTLLFKPTKSANKVLLRVTDTLHHVAQKNYRVKTPPAR